MTPTFSVLMAAYNAAETIELSIQSVLRQSDPDFELIVIDDGSTDDTAVRATSFETDQRVKVVSLGENRGLAGALNAGVERARGSLLSFLDSDDLMMPAYLESMGRALDGAPGYGLAYTDAWLVDATTRRVRRETGMGRVSPRGGPPADPEAFMIALARRNFIVGEPTVHRQAVLDAGGFDEGLSVAEDYDLWFRMLANGCHPTHVPGCLLVLLDRPDSLSKNAVAIAEADLMICGRIIDEYDVSASVQAQAREQKSVTERHLRRLTADNGLRLLYVRARRTAASIKRNALRGPTYYATPPGELADSYPELFAAGAPTSH